MICIKTIAGKVALSAILCALMLPCFTLEIQASGPAGITHQFYGTVTGSGGLVGAGYTVTAIVDGQQVASTTTDSHGQWGYSPLFVVTAPSSSSIEFYVNGVLAGTAAGCISTNRLDLIYNAPVKPSSSANTVTAVEGGGGTITFYIGPQPTGSKPGKSVPVESTPTISAPPVTSIAVTGLLASPQVATAGDDVTITVSIVNRGNIEFSGGVVLKINDVVDQQKDVTLSVGETRTLAFPVKRSEPGNYRATVDDYSTEFVIKERPAVTILQPQVASNTSAQQPGDPDDTRKVSTLKGNQLIPDSPLLALAVLVVGCIIAIYLVTLIIRQGSSRY
jgi:uncharacterized repeat protein (TIGR01451 family)